MNKKQKYPKALQSSVNPNNLSLTIKGILISLIPAAIIVAKYAGYTTDEATLMNIIEQITIIISVVVTVTGLFRKLVVSLKK